MNALWEGENAHKEFLERSERDAVDVALAAEHDILRLQYWRWHEKPMKRLDEYTFLFGAPEKSWYTIRFDPEIELFHRTEGYGTRSTNADVERKRKQTAQIKSMDMEKLEADLKKQKIEEV